MVLLFLFKENVDLFHISEKKDDISILNWYENNIKEFNLNNNYYFNF